MPNMCGLSMEWLRRYLTTNVATTCHALVLILIDSLVNPLNTKWRPASASVASAKGGRNIYSVSECVRVCVWSENCVRCV